MNRKTALLASVSVRPFASNPIIGTAPDGRPLRAITPRNATGPVIGQLYALPSDATLSDDPVMRRSPDSAEMLEYWDLTDALVDGHAAVKKAGERYLPKFEAEDATKYQTRLRLTKYTNIYRDIIESLASKPFEQEISIVKDDEDAVPAEIAAFCEDVDGSGNNLTVFGAGAFFNGINSAIHWIFVDHPVADPTIRNVADAKAAGIRPFWSHVLGRNVLWATVEMIGGKETLTYMKIYEPGTPDHVREFVRSADGAVSWRLLEKTKQAGADGKPQWVEVGTGTVSIGVIPLVPFATGRRDGRTFKYFPAMRDAADLQVELYQQESGLKFIKTMGAYSMLAGQGVRPILDEANNPKKLIVGPLAILYAPTDGNGNAGKWEFIQPDAAVMTFLAGDVKETIAQLRELGRVPLTAQSGNITVITASTAAGKSRSAVGSWALLLKDTLENAMVLTCKFMANSTVVPVHVYNEFDDFTEGKDLEAIQAMRANKDLSRETQWEEFKRRGVLSNEFDPEKEEERLLKEVPSDGVDTGTEDNPNGPSSQE